MTKIYQETIEEYLKNAFAKKIIIVSAGCKLTLQENGENRFNDADGEAITIHKWMIITRYYNDTTNELIEVGIGPEKTRDIFYLYRPELYVLWKAGKQ